jgi:hypothetical protein
MAGELDGYHRDCCRPRTDQAASSDDTRWTSETVRALMAFGPPANNATGVPGFAKVRNLPGLLGTDGVEFVARAWNIIDGTVEDDESRHNGYITTLGWAVRLALGQGIPVEEVERAMGVAGLSQRRFPKR